MTPIIHTTLHHGDDILQLTVKNLRYDDGFLCSNRTFDAIEVRLRECIKSQRPKKFITKDRGAIMKIMRVV